MLNIVVVHAVGHDEALFLTIVLINQYCSTIIRNPLFVEPTKQEFVCKPLQIMLHYYHHIYYLIILWEIIEKDHFCFCFSLAFLYCHKICYKYCNLLHIISSYILCVYAFLWVHNQVAIKFGGKSMLILNNVDNVT